MNYTQHQSKVIKAVQHWANSPSSPQVFKVFGYAGTGKTTVTKAAVAGIKDVLYAAYTGKAALVMSKHGMPASTIHSLIYSPAGEDPTDLNELKEALEAASSPISKKILEGKIKDEIRRLSNPSFCLKPDSLVTNAGLVVIDECSMVSERLGRDLLSFGTKVLVLGDPFQLPPVGGSGFFTEGRPDEMLTEIHRQAKESPIIRMSMAIREGRQIVDGSWDKGEHGKASKVSKGEVDLMEFDQVLTGKNVTRRSLNMLVRQSQGFSGGPQKGERLICLRNNKDLGLLNGQFVTLTSNPEPDAYKPFHRANILTEGGAKLFDISLLNAHFDEYETPGASKDMTYSERRVAEEFDFSGAVTVHKSQGSQFGSVLLYDDGFLKGKKTDRAKWLYTACTRAENEFCWAL